MKKGRTTFLQLGNIEIPRSDKIKYLGEIWDSYLIFKNPIKEISTKAAKSLYLLWQVRKYLTQESAKQMAVSLIISNLDYVNCLYYGLQENTIKPLSQG